MRISYYLVVSLLGFIANLVLYVLFTTRLSIRRSWLGDYKRSLSRLFWGYIIFAFLLQGEIADVALFGSVGAILRQKIDFYFIDSSHGAYAFFPFLSYYYLLVNFIVEPLAFIHFSFMVKLLFIPALFGVSRFIGDREQRLRFLLSPVVFAPVVFHGQPDILLIYFLIASVMAVDTKLIKSGIYLGLSILTKTWSVIVWPSFLFNLKLKRFIIHAISAVAVVFVSTFIYTRCFGSSFTVVFKAVTGHPGSSVGYWGLTLPIQLLKDALPTAVVKVHDWLKPHQSLFLLPLLLGVQVAARLKRLSLIKTIKVTLLAFNVFAIGWGVQYIIWVLPFAYLDGDYKRAGTYSLLAAPYLLLTYLTIVINQSSGQEAVSQLLALVLSILPWAYSASWLSLSLEAEQ